MKECVKCHKNLPVESFYVKDGKTGRRHTQCKDCYKAYRSAYYAATYPFKRKEYQARARKYRAKVRKIFRENMLNYLRDKSCVLCGENDIRTFEFDHINPIDKHFSISQTVRLGRSWEEVENEINKCRILCANCHKKHTSTQANWYKEVLY